MTTDQVHARHMLATSLVTGLDHVGIAVADLDVAIEWYHDHLGMILVHEEINDDQGIREALLAVPGSAAQIQLMAPLDESSVIAKFLDKRGPGIQQLACRVSDLDAMCRRLRSQGVRLVYETARRGTANSRRRRRPPRRRRLRRHRRLHPAGGQPTCRPSHVGGRV
ncbi:4-hydroxyphenylpyruvate dioxygenase [Mycobacterium tuberculosis]|nr:4-hydroxyphenylpyruvate dioxygenase [Mycobacterium tuberculosis]CKX99924.1 4-hydroxyphenylpyruvate dioxygenase [Mycobacterium tuberculosis]CKZ87687.1 4-hydroxyphenylpyruvate dioxygenase [Mycobacterium tuberculosis]